MTFLKKYVGSRDFYKTVLILVLPLVVQNGITNFVSLLDNLMVGRVGTLQMSAVSIVNQLIFIFNLTIFGGLSGASIFSAQFCGLGDYRGMRDAFRFKMLFGLAASAIAVAVFLLFGDDLTMLFLKSEENTPEEIALTMEYARSYMDVALIGLLPFMVVQVYAGTLREMEETVAPMKAGVLAILVNLTFNYILIYGKFGAPALGVAGAAIATVMARFVEMIYVVIHTHRRADRYPFIKGAYRSMRVPMALVKKIAVTGTPLLLNEILWSLGMTVINGNYAQRGLVVVAATNISTTAWNLFCVIMFAMGTAVSVMGGQKLGAGDLDGAMDVDRKLIFLTVVSHLMIGLLVVVCAPLIPLLYDVEPEVKTLAAQCLRIAGASLPFHALIHVIYFAIRSGGKTVVTFLFDSGFTWCVPAALSWILCRYTGLDILWIYFIIQFCDIIKVMIGIPMFRSGVWAKNVVSDLTEKTKATTENAISD